MLLLIIQYSPQFRRELKKLRSNPKAMEELKKVIDLLIEEEELPEKYKDHKLIGIGYKDSHLRPDTLLIYNLSGNLLELARVGSHSKLF